MNHFSRMANYALVRRRLMSAPASVPEDLGPKVVVRRRDSDFAQRRYAMEAEQRQVRKAQVDKAVERLPEEQRGVLARPPWHEILEQVAKTHGLTVEDIRGRSRDLHVVSARQEAAYRLNGPEAKMSLHQIGALLGGRTHNTALMSIRAYARRNGLPAPQPAYYGGRWLGGTP